MSGRFGPVVRVAETGSTNSDLGAAARAGDVRDGAVLVADYQRVGRGRLGRGWASPPGAGLLVSVLVVPRGVPVPRWGWLPLLAGLALAEAVSTVTHGVVAPRLKWPNDLVVGDRKVAGVLVERVETAAGPAAVIGTGTNVTTTATQLPEGAASLALCGASGVEREALLAEWLSALGGWLDRWERAGGDVAASGLAAAYADRSATLGRRVRAVLPGGEVVEGVATRLDGDGRLVVTGVAGAAGVAGVTGVAGERSLAAGDVVHLR